MGMISIVVLGILIFVHELGHFLVAKYYRIGVLEFAIGFGPKIFSKRIGETKYSLRLIPLGGYVRMVGDTPDQLVESITPPEAPGDKSSGEVAVETDVETAVEIDEVEAALLKDKSRWFLTQSLWPRAAVVFAGPFFNILFAYLLAVGSFTAFGALKPNDGPFIGDVIPDFPAAKAGIVQGDKVLEINGEKVVAWPQIKEFVEKAGSGEINFKIERKATGGGDEIVSYQLRSKETGPEVDYLAGDGTGKKTFMVGVRQSLDRIPATFFQSLKYGGLQVAGTAFLNVKSIYGLVKGIISPDNLGGPIAIFREASRSARKGIEDLMDFMVFLSVSLAVLNLLPVPVLDGGHLTFFLIEAIIRKPVGLKVQEYATRVGMFLLFALTIYALKNDLRNLFMT